MDPELKALFAQRARKQETGLKRQREEEHQQERRDEEERKAVKLVEDALAAEEAKRSRAERLTRDYLNTLAGRRINQIYGWENDAKQCGDPSCQGLTKEQLMTIPVDRIVVIGGCCYDCFNAWDSGGYCRAFYSFNN